MLGLFQEIGPFVINDGDYHFTKNEHSWNKEANLLFIEAPAGVGFSTCEGKCEFNDTLTAKDNLASLISFFTDIFPEFSTNDLYLAGESYSGIYVPYLANEIHEYNSKQTDAFLFNLKGYIVGNGCTNWKYDVIPAYVEMGFMHGLYDYDLRKQLE